MPRRKIAKIPLGVPKAIHLLRFYCADNPKEPSYDALIWKDVTKGHIATFQRWEDVSIDEAYAHTWLTGEQAYTKRAELSPADDNDAGQNGKFSFLFIEHWGPKWYLVLNYAYPEPNPPPVEAHLIGRYLANRAKDRHEHIRNGIIPSEDGREWWVVVQFASPRMPGSGKIGPSQPMRG